MDLWTALLSFAGTLTALAVTKSFEHALTRRLQAQHLTRDSLADLASTLTSVEGAFRILVAAKLPSSRSELVATPSGWDISAPSIKLEKLLGAFDSEEIHRLAMLFYERHESFVRLSKQHEDAYYWLLDRSEGDWTEPKAAERIGRIEYTRTEMSDRCRDMLRFGYQLAELLFQLADRPGVTSILRQTPVSEFLREHLSLDERALRLRRAFYSLQRPSFLFDPAISWSFVSWSDDLARRVRPLKGVLTLGIEFQGQDGKSRTEYFMIPPFMEVALPSAGISRSGHVWWPGATEPCEIRPLPMQPNQLPNDGNTRRRISIGPEAASILSKLPPSPDESSHLLLP